jgi:hypothetical protein
MQTLLLVLLLSPVVTAVYLTAQDRHLIAYHGWHFFTAMLLAYLWVLLVLAFLVVPMHFLVAVYLPLPISLIEQAPYKYWFPIPLFIVLNELHLTAIACLVSSWWLATHLRHEWQYTFQNSSKHG